MTWSVHFSPLSFLQVCLSWPKDTILEAGDSSRHVFANCVCVYIFHVGNRRTVHPAELTQLSLTAYKKLLSILVSDASVYSKIFVFIWCCLAGPRILQLHAGCLITHFLKVIKLRTDHKSFAVQVSRNFSIQFLSQVPYKFQGVGDCQMRLVQKNKD